MELINYKNLFFDDSESSDGTQSDNTQPDNTQPDNTETGDKGKDGDDKKNSARNDKKYSDDDLNRIINDKFAKWQKQQEKAVDEAKKLANMTAQERVEHERDKLKAELDALKHANAIAEMEKTARGILQADGVNVPDAIISSLVSSDDAETTSENVKAFSKAFKAAVQAEVKAQLSHKSPTTGATGKTMTKEEINKITDPVKRQEAIRNNLALYGYKK